MRKIKLILGASILLLSSQANAGIIITGYINPLEEFGLRQEMPYALFDSSLGTLDFINITTIFSAQVSYTLDNDSPDSIAFDYGIAAEAYFSLIANDVFLNLGPLQAVTLGSDDGDGAGGQNGGPDEQDFTAMATGQLTSSNLDSSSYYSRPGGGVDTIICDLYSQISTIPFHDLEFSHSFLGSCGVILEYHFTEASVPEPPAILLFGIGLIGLIGFSRRRKAA